MSGITQHPLVARAEEVADEVRNIFLFVVNSPKSAVDVFHV